RGDLHDRGLGDHYGLGCGIIGTEAGNHIGRRTHDDQQQHHEDPHGDAGGAGVASHRRHGDLRTVHTDRGLHALLDRGEFIGIGTGPRIRHGGVSSRAAESKGVSILWHILPTTSAGAVWTRGGAGLLLNTVTDYGASMIERPIPGADAPIGIFDSGVGGLTVARTIIDQLPHESIIYIGDTANGPYGPLPIARVREHALRIADELVERGCKMIVIACNTASAAFLRDARERYDVPVVEVILPAVRRAVAATRNGKVGVIGTVGTINSGAYQ